jgi:hypothetical protein
MAAFAILSVVVIVTYTLYTKLVYGVYTLVTGQVCRRSAPAGTDFDIWLV